MPSSKKTTRVKQAELLAQARVGWSKNKAEGQTRAQLSAAMRRIDELETQVAGQVEFSEIEAEIHDLRPGKGGRESESIAFVLASDWHVELITTLELTNGISETNPALAKIKAERFFTNSAKLIDILARDTKVKRIVMPALGDFIDNHLHEDSAEQVAMMPVQAAGFARDLLASGIKFWRKTFPRIPISVICHSGNHGRATRKVHVSTEHGHSWETMVYGWLQAEFGPLGIEVQVPQSPISYHRYWDHTIRMMHGHQVKYQGGIGGMHIPLNRALARWDQSRQAQTTFLGHFHQLTDTGRAVVNGSLCGYTGYAQWIAASPEPPQQWFQVLANHKGGRRAMRAPIWLDR